MKLGVNRADYRAFKGTGRSLVPIPRKNNDESGYQTGRPPDQHAGSVVLKVLCIWVIAPAPAPGCTITLLMLHSNDPR